MADPRLQLITDIAAALRDSILLTPRAERPVGLRDFPAGSCGDTALLLGTMLSEAGFGEFNCVSAERGDKRDRTWRSHGWVEQNSLIIDITADQFPEKSETVIVTHESPWHARFRVTRRDVAHLAAFEGPSIPELREYYNSIKQNVVLLVGGSINLPTPHRRLFDA